MVLRGRHSIALRMYKVYIWQSITVAQRFSLFLVISLNRRFCSMFSLCTAARCWHVWLCCTRQAMFLRACLLSTSRAPLIGTIKRRYRPSPHVTVFPMQKRSHLPILLKPAWSSWLARFPVHEFRTTRISKRYSVFNVPGWLHRYSKHSENQD